MNNRNRLNKQKSHSKTSTNNNLRNYKCKGRILWKLLQKLRKSKRNLMSRRNKLKGKSKKNFRSSKKHKNNLFRLSNILNNVRNTWNKKRNPRIKTGSKNNKNRDKIMTTSYKRQKLHWRTKWLNLLQSNLQ